jgi:hypothetical protein
LLATGESRFVVIAACLIALLGITIGGHLYGRFLSARDLGGRDAAIEQLQSESQKFKREIDDKSAQIGALQTKLASAQATLEAIMPSENSYNVNPNQTLIVANGHLTLGLVGSPGNEGVILNINGKQQTVAAGQILAVTPDASTKCAVTVQSFDMFRAVVNASCADVKPQ